MKNCNLNRLFRWKKKRKEKKVNFVDCFWGISPAFCTYTYLLYVLTPSRECTYFGPTDEHTCKCIHNALLYNARVQTVCVCARLCARLRVCTCTRAFVTYAPWISDGSTHYRSIQTHATVGFPIHWIQNGSAAVNARVRVINTRKSADCRPDSAVGTPSPPSTPNSEGIRVTHTRRVVRVGDVLYDNNVYAARCAYTGRGGRGLGLYPSPRHRTKVKKKFV